MDEVKWYENNSLESIKNIIKDNINTASRSFLAIGYYLKNVRERKLYQQDGYKDVWEFAQTEFGISQSWASRYMSINDRFSKDGNSPMIQDEYKDFDKSKLSEMLTLTDEQLKQVTLTTTVAQIKDIKKSYATSHKTESEKIEPHSANGELKTVRSDDSLINTPGCGNGKYDCFTCSRDCQIREDDRYCEEAPMGNPFCCETMYIIDDEILEIEAKNKCMFINLNLAKVRVGDKEPSPCCKECMTQCKYACSKSQKPKSKEIEPIVKKSDWEAGVFEDDRAAYGATRAEIVHSLINQMESVSDIDQINGECCNALGISYYAYNIKNDGYITLERDNGSFLFKINVDRVKNEYEWFKSLPVNNIQKSVTETAEIVNDEPENVTGTVETVIEEPENVIDLEESEIIEKECVECNYFDMDPDKYFELHPDTDKFPCNDCDDKLNNWIPKIENPVDNSDSESEIVEADVIHTEPDNKTSRTTDKLFKGIPLGIFDKDGTEIKEGDLLFADWVNETYQMTWIPRGLGFKACLQKEANTNHETLHCNVFYNKMKVIGNIYGDTIHEEVINMGSQEEPETKPEQPELPILKNNDQRKEFIDNYTSWPVWIDQTETGERYYRYNLTDTVAIVVKVSKKHIWKRYKETEDIDYSHEEYYLLGIKSNYSTKGNAHIEDESRTFYECNTNKSALVEYLKEIQKKG